MPPPTVRTHVRVLFACFVCAAVWKVSIFFELNEKVASLICDITGGLKAISHQILRGFKFETQDLRRLFSIGQKSALIVNLKWNERGRKQSPFRGLDEVIILNLIILIIILITSCQTHMRELKYKPGYM